MAPSSQEMEPPVKPGWFNNGIQDIALTLTEHNSVAILIGRPGGTYTEAGFYSVGEAPYKLATADLNGDTFSDIAVANVVGMDISILLGDGKGSFGVAIRVPLAASPRWLEDVPSDLAIGEFNSDGIPDLVVVHSWSDLVAVFLGKGDGSFSPHVRIPGARSLVLIDANGDSLSDMAILSLSKITVLLGSGDSYFTLGSEIEVGENSYGLQTGDLNGNEPHDS